MEEIEELNCVAGIHPECLYRAKETQHRAEEKTMAMDSRLAKAVEDLSFAEKLLFVERERLDDLAKELCILQ